MLIMFLWLQKEQKTEAAPAVEEPAAEKPAEVNDKPSVTETMARVCYSLALV